jgi:DNA-directed RNA polymerase specialized sigma24 family protein
MPVAEDVIVQARRSNRQAVEAVLTESFPAVHRMSHALTGRPDIAQRVIRSVMRQGIRVMPRWRRGITPENWFYHHTLLTARVAAPQPPSVEADVLVTSGPTAQPEYTAFIIALRRLPRQQMEAFILNHGEQFNVRLLGVAMDCSTGASTNHLQAAVDALQSITGDRFPKLVAALEKAYARLTPPPTLAPVFARQQASAVLWRIRLRKFVRRAIVVALLCAVALAVWRWHALLLHWFELVRSRAQSRPA